MAGCGMNHYHLVYQIKGRLKEKVSLQIQSSESCYDEEWEIALITEDNKYPYWLRWAGNDIEKLLQKVLNYLDGKEKQPHGREEVPPSAWQE